MRTLVASAGVGAEPPLLLLPRKLLTLVQEGIKIAFRGGGFRRGKVLHILFNRKSTAFQQALEKLEKRLDTIEIENKEDKSANARNLLEFADLGEKMRRTYLRLSRIVKIDSEQPSGEETPLENGEQKKASPREIRDAINQTIGL